jgi:hypothetical protein
MGRRRAPAGAPRRPAAPCHLAWAPARPAPPEPEPWRRPRRPARSLGGPGRPGWGPCARQRLPAQGDYLGGWPRRAERWRRVGRWRKGGGGGGQAPARFGGWGFYSAKARHRREGLGGAAGPGVLAAGGRRRKWGPQEGPLGSGQWAAPIAAVGSGRHRSPRRVKSQGARGKVVLQAENPCRAAGRGAGPWGAGGEVSCAAAQARLGAAGGKHSRGGGGAAARPGRLRQAQPGNTREHPSPPRQFGLSVRQKCGRSGRFRASVGTRSGRAAVPRCGPRAPLGLGGHTAASANTSGLKCSRCSGGQGRGAGGTGAGPVLRVRVHRPVDCRGRSARWCAAQRGAARAG